MSYFWNIQLNLSQKGKSIAPKTVNYFQEHRKKEFQNQEIFFWLDNWLQFEI